MVQVCGVWRPWVLRLHGFRAPADGYLPWPLQSLFPARLRGSAPFPSSSRRPARRRVGCQSGPAGPAETAACAWREVPDWPGFVARALQGLRLGKECLQLHLLGARMLRLPVKEASGCWTYREGSPLAGLLRHRSLRKRLLQRWLPKRPLVPVQGPVLEQLLNSLELVPVMRLLRLLRQLVQPADRAAAPPARGAAERSGAAVVQHLGAATAIAAIGHGQWIWLSQVVDRGTGETPRSAQGGPVRQP